MESLFAGHGAQNCEGARSSLAVPQRKGTMQAPFWGDDDGDGVSQTHTWNLTTELITTVVRTLANLQAQEQEHWTTFLGLWGEETTTSCNHKQCQIYT